MTLPKAAHLHTVKRGPDRARVVITLEIQVSQTWLRSLPSYKRDAVFALRNVTSLTPAKLIAHLNRTTKYTVLESKIEVCK